VTPVLPLTVLVATRNDEVNIERCLTSLQGFAGQVFVLDSESSDRTRELARPLATEVRVLPYDHTRIIPWIFQWGLDHLPIEHEWVLILEADQALPPELRAEIAALLAGGGAGPAENGFYIRRKQIFRGKWIRFGGYGRKRLLKLFRRGCGELDPLEQDTRVYVRGRVGRLESPLEEWNRKEDSILFYLEKHLRYAEAFAREELERRRGGIPFKLKPKLFGASDERTLWLKARYYRMPLFVRPALYFAYRYVLRLGVLDGKTGFLFHFLQAFWFRLVVDVRLEELLREGAGAEAGAGAGGEAGGEAGARGEAGAAPREEGAGGP
jgi:glycosyltransferase involved in cell wall biosynthesis